jgi:SAM-dependent methyltransferase
MAAGTGSGTIAALTTDAHIIPAAAADTPELRLGRMLDGYRVSQALHVAARIGIADALAAGPRGAEDLARACDCHAGALYRLLRALAGVGVLHENAGRFSLTELGEALRGAAVAAPAAFVGRPYHWDAWSHLEHSVRTGENAFRGRHGTDVWNYRAQHPEEGERFQRAMAAITGAVNEAVLDAYDFARFDTVVDVGGGHGAFLAALLERHQHVDGVLFDRPHVLARASGMPAAAAARCRVVCGSFFEAVPPGGDAYVLKSVLHDWEDAEALAILRVCRRALAPGATLLVIERDLGAPNADPDAKLNDLNMLVVPGGRERTRGEYGALLVQAGLECGRATRAPGGMLVLDATAAAVIGSADRPRAESRW